MKDRPKDKIEKLSNGTYRITTWIDRKTEEKLGRLRILLGMEEATNEELVERLIRETLPLLEMEALENLDETKSRKH